MEARGYSIGKSALHRYGSEFEDKLAALKMSSEQAKAVVQAAPDDEGAVNEALMRLVQEHLFKLLMAADGKIDLPKVAKAVAELGRASVVKRNGKPRSVPGRKPLQSQVEKIAKKGGLSAKTVEEIRREILGGGVVKVIHQFSDEDGQWLDANEQSMASARAAGWKTRAVVELADALKSDSVRSSIIGLIADDGYAALFQTLGQYRAALIRAVVEGPAQ
ncbi:DUF3486 family protein [Pseudomonas qingdaonensis]|nr:DUF3486 family protein [Pseudomonas qingdaonensis]